MNEREYLCLESEGIPCGGVFKASELEERVFVTDDGTTYADYCPVCHGEVMFK